MTKPKPLSEMTIDEVTDLIYTWGHDRKIIENSTPLAQSKKTIEEVHELIEACTRYSMLDAGVFSKDIKKLISTDSDIEPLVDALGDVYVTLCMIAGCAGLDIQSCISHAYEQIKDRTGHLREDGVFVKEG